MNTKSLITGNWYEVAVKGIRTSEKGVRKAFTELYVTSGFSFAEAERKIIEEVSEFYEEEYNVICMNIATYGEITFNESADIFFKVKVCVTVCDEKTGKEKASPVIHLIQAKSIDEANRIAKDIYDHSLLNYRIAEIKETKIIDVFCND